MKEDRGIGKNLHTCRTSIKNENEFFMGSSETLTTSTFASGKENCS